MANPHMIKPKSICTVTVSNSDLDLCLTSKEVEAETTLFKDGSSVTHIKVFTERPKDDSD